LRAASGTNSISKQAVFAAFPEREPGLDKRLAMNVNPAQGGYKWYDLSMEERIGLTAKVSWSLSPVCGPL